MDYLMIQIDILNNYTCCKKKGGECPPPSLWKPPKLNLAS